MAHLFTTLKSKSRTSSTSSTTQYPLSDLTSPSSPHRTFSDPIAYSLSRRTSTTSSNFSRSSTLATVMPRSSEHSSLAKDEKFELDRSRTRDSDPKTRRTRSNDQKINVYTECGRHGDDWLFGGFSVSGTMKMLWEKRE